MNGSPSMLPAAVTVSFALPLSPADLLALVKTALATAAEKVVAEQVADETVISLEEAVRMTPWTEAGFKRVAGKQNLPFIKGLHKSPPSYRRGAVIAMLRRMQVWPHGRPVEALKVA